MTNEYLVEPTTLSDVEISSLLQVRHPVLVDFRCQTGADFVMTRAPISHLLRYFRRMMVTFMVTATRVSLRLPVVKMKQNWPVIVSSPEDSKGDAARPAENHLARPKMATSEAGTYHSTHSKPWKIGSPTTRIILIQRKLKRRCSPRMQESR